MGSVRTSRRRREIPPKVSKTFRLAPGKLAAAQRILATTTATATIETALDMVVFRRELVEGTRAMLGVRLTPPDGRSRA